MNRLEKEQVLPTLKGLLNKIKNGNGDILGYEADALSQVIEQYETKERPMAAYLDLETDLMKQSDKPLEVKSAILWGGLWIVYKMGCITWNTALELYGEYMSKQMHLR